MFRSERMTCARLGAVALAASTALLLGACGPKATSAGGEGAATEVAAKVNGDDITVSQIELALQRQRGARPDASDGASRQVLEQLIDEQIIVQKALATKLDKDPKVVEQLEAARRDILARRFIEAGAETAGKPADDQVQKFYDAHANIFAQRRVFTLQRTDIQAPDERRTEIDAHIQSLKSGAELADWLKAQNLRYSAKQEQTSSEQLPPALLDKLSSMKDGESTAIPAQGGVSALTLVSSAAAPKTLAEARPAIEQYLSTQGRREVVMNLQKTLRDGAKIDYQGRFAASAAAAGDVHPAASATPSSAASAASSVASPASQNNPAQK